MTGAPRFERPDAADEHVPAPGGRAGTRDYDPEQTRRRLRDLRVFAGQAAEIVAAGQPAFLAPSAWQPRAAGTYLIIEIATVAEKLHPRVKEHFSDVPWHRIRAMRNIAAHRYDDVNDQIVWDVLATFVPSLASDLGLDPGSGGDVTLPAALS